ncbi:ParA family protein [Sphingobacterium sp. BIGb0116]|uniref:ParA family protein n=1 Tax=Sphingobacterium sp. BIGb0116 TaxID=2940619 RepID=UPI00216A93C9|nr:AAA family ATPase [Sphingobacterium sp. BIGb0116]MCS4165142.1 cellulose biosynthesis protein BcsQ [Sphingobacterium sp. BIGb0116]
MDSIVIFNNKGGVGKTTLLSNLSAFLKIVKGKKVLIVDADPQCNATAYLFPFPDIDKIYDNHESKGTLYDVLRPVQRGRGYLKTALPIITSPNFKVDVIPGDPRLSLMEDFLGKDWIDGRAGDHRGLQTTLVFKDLLCRTSIYDYVIFDVGPSLGALNRAILIACDYFLVPMSSDIFSLRAIENISLALKEWKEGIELGLSEYKRKEMENYEVGDRPFSWNLKFIGYVTQQYTAKTVNGSKIPVNAFEKIIKKIPGTIKRELGPFNNLLDPSSFKLGEIPNLHSLVPLSQNSNTPIFALQAKDGVVGAHFNKVREYFFVIENIANNLHNNLEASLS